MPSSKRERSHADLIVGSPGIVFGDIGTSPIYALRQDLMVIRCRDACAWPE